MSYENMMNLLAKLHIDRVKNLSKYESIEDIEFKVFSQWGEDGIIQYLINKLPIQNKFFIEFGVENYRESNTRFLLMNNNWSGLVIDGSDENINFIHRDSIYWKYDLKAIASFITKENINNLISKYIPNQDIGLLSIDIDGNDYWIWEAINCIKPVIVICEYNSIFGNRAKITIPYRNDFFRTKAHFSNLYFGASLTALESLAKKKGYTFFGCTSAGNDAFFIRNDMTNLLKSEIDKASYVYSKARESRDENGNLTFLQDQDRIKSIENKKVYDLDKKYEIKISDLWKAGEILYV